MTPIKDQGQVRKPIPSTRLRCIHLLVSLPLAAVRAQLASCAVAQCGSCTMFSACALLESYYHIKKNLAVTSTQVMDLSEQYFVNCVNSQARNTNTNTQTAVVVVSRRSSTSTWTESTPIPRAGSESATQPLALALATAATGGKGR